VGLIGGAPKCCKTWLALDLAVSVASGTPALGRFSVRDRGPVLFYGAEDAAAHLRTRIEAIAAASPRIEALIFGPGDFAASLGIPQLSVGGEEPLYPGDRWHYALSRIIVTARAFGQQAIDGPYAAIRDLDGLRRVATASRLLGYDGKWAVHPDQVAVCNEVFQPTQEEFDRAAQLEAAYAEATSEKRLGAVVHNNEMIDEASRKMAEAVLLRGRAAGMTATKGSSDDRPEDS